MRNFCGRLVSEEQLTKLLEQPTLGDLVTCAGIQNANTQHPKALTPCIKTGCTQLAVNMSLQHSSPSHDPAQTCLSI